MEATSSHVVCTNASVLNATTLLATPSHPSKIDAKKAPLIGKIPVVIAEADVQVYVDATVQLNEPALEITNVKKNVFLNRCQLLMTDDKKSSKLLLSGYVRKSIQYSIPKHVEHESISGNIHFTTVIIPFKCFTKIDFVSEPVTHLNPDMSSSSNLANDGMGSDPSLINISNAEILNEKIFCELISAKIREIDIKKDIERLPCPTGKALSERTFKTFLESMVIELKLRVMQNQNVYISLSTGSSQDGHGGGGGGRGNSYGEKGGNCSNKSDCSEGRDGDRKDNKKSDDGSDRKSDKKDDAKSDGCGDGKGDRKDDCSRESKDGKKDHKECDGKEEKKDGKHSENKDEHKDGKHDDKKEEQKECKDSKHTEQDKDDKENECRDDRKDEK